MAHGQSLVWDDFWYGGSYGIVSYGVVYYLVARVVGAQVVVVLSAGLLPLLFHLYVRRAWQVTSLLPASALAVVGVLYLTNGQDPFLLAMALTMAGLALLAGDHPLWAAVPVGVAAFTNPVAVAAGAVFVVADALAHPAARRRTALFAAALVPFAAAWFTVLLAFRAHVSYLAQPAVLLRWTAVAVVGIVLARWSRDPDRRALQILFAAAAALCLAALAVPNELGNNAARFLVLFGLPALLMIRRVRLPRAATAALLAAVAAVTLTAPVGDLLRTGDAAQTTRAFFAPALAYARQTYDPDYPHPRRGSAAALGGQLLPAGRPAHHAGLVSPERLAARRGALPDAHPGPVRRLAARPGRARRLRAACHARLQQLGRTRADRVREPSCASPRPANGPCTACAGRRRSWSRRAPRPRRPPRRRRPRRRPTARPSPRSRAPWSSCACSARGGTW